MAHDDAVPTLALANRKEYASNASMSGLEADDFYPPSWLPLFDVEALSKDGFGDKYAIDGWLEFDFAQAVCVQMWGSRQTTWLDPRRCAACFL